MNRAFAALSPTAGAALEQDLLAMIDSFNTAGADSMVAPAEYLEIVMTREGSGGLH